MKIYYVKNNSARAKRFQLTTTLFEEGGKKFVKKEASCPEAIPHLMAMKDHYRLLSSAIVDPRVKLAKIIEETPSSLTFEFIEGISLEKRYYNAAEKSRTEAAKVIEQYREFILSSFKTVEMTETAARKKRMGIFNTPLSSNPDTPELYFDGVTNIDLIFSNILYSDDEIYIIDYEWIFNFPLPVEYIYYRAIMTLNNLGTKENILSNKQIAYYTRLEEYFTLEYVFDKTSFYQIQHYYLKNKINPSIEIQEKDELIAELIQEKNELIRDKDELIQSLSNQIEELKEIAQSLRIKNRIKRLDPRRLLSPLKTIQANPAVLKKVLYYAKRGEFRYLWTKIREKDKKNLSQSSALEVIDPSHYFKPFSVDEYTLGDRTIDIIIPVYNGYEFLTPLFDSIERNTTSAYRLIVINDCSPDERVKPLLEERLRKHPDAIFINHEINLGFVKSVNEGRAHTRDHFLILNTDTEVPKYWMERLMHPIIYRERIATTTPFTNSGQIASFPNFIADNDIFEGMSVDALDRVFREVNPEPFYAEVPTGVGFCMGVNYDLTQEIGFFVEEEFGKGYGEENDWCQRAIRQGYSNIIVPNLFVYHKHGGSFSAEEKQKLMKENAIKLLHKHPNYDKDVETYVRRDPHKTLRELLVIIAASRKQEGVHLVIDQALGGGANHYTEDLVKRYLEEGKKVLRLIYDYYAHTFILHFDYKTYHFSYTIKTFEQVKTFIARLKLRELFLNNLVSFQEPIEVLQWIEALVDTEHTELTLPIHDYYSICQNYTLLDPQGVFCEIPDSLQECRQCLKHNTLEWKTFVSTTVDIQVWRKEWGKLLAMSDTIICFSRSSRELLTRAYRELDTEKIVITPHQVDPLPPVTPSTKTQDHPVTLGILGAINQAKGAEIVRELTERIDREKLPVNVVLIGEISTTISSDAFMATGRYRREKLPELVRKYEIDIFLIPSVCPETFSYTTQEIMMMEMPLMVFDIGAPPERVRSYPRGIVLGKDYLEHTLDYLKNYRNLQ